MQTYRTRSYSRAAWLVVASLVCSLAVVTPAHAARVAYVSDGVAGQPCTPPCPSGDCTPPPCFTNLQEAIESFANEPENPDDPLIIEVGPLREQPYGTPITYNAQLVFTKSIHLVAVSPNITLSGGFQARPITIDGTGAERPINVRVSGFTIAYGNATNAPALPGQPPNERLGGAIYIRNASPVIEYNDIRDSFASDDANDGFGGGIYVEGGAPIIRFNTIQANTAGDTSADFTRVARRGHGGGVALIATGAQVIGNVIANNISGKNQGIGGGLYLNTDPESGPNALISGNIIRGNRSQGPAAPGYAGGIYTFAASPTLINNVIARNTDRDGGPGLLSDGGSITLWNNTFDGNTSNNTEAPGIAIALRSGATLDARNNIIANQSVGYYGDDSIEQAAAARTLFAGAVDNQTVGNIANNNALEGDPAFVDTSELPDYRIGAGSAARDQGVRTNVALDADGRMRLGAPDVGAYEYHLDTFVPFAQQ